MLYERRDLTDNDLLRIYQDIVLPRLVEEKMLILLRQGRLSKWFSGIGQEGIAVGATSALRNSDYILPLHRNLGVFTTRGIELTQLFAQWQGKAAGFTQGRDRSFHFGSLEHRVIGMISHLGAMLPVADGLALASLLDQSGDIAMVFSGDGGASEGDFHEALNVAAVWELPVIFLVENNGYGLSTPSNEQFKAASLADRALGYGMRGLSIDGNNILEVYHTVQTLAAQMRENPQPVLLECRTFRMRGHEEASGTKYVPQELFDEWGKKDPVANFEAFLKEEGVLDDDRIASIRNTLKARINQEVNEAWDLPEPEVIAEKELTEVFAPAPTNLVAPGSVKKEIRFIDAISDGLREGMRAHPELVIMGQDVAEYGGVFKITDGFVEEFGKGRVRNTPICESAIVGAAMGLSLAGKKAVMEMQFADFVSCGFNQIVNNLAKNHYRWGHAPDVVVRMPTGGGTGAGPYHSQSIESWFTHVPGLKIVCPSTPEDAKGLLLSAILDPNPVMFFEHKFLYRSETGMVPEGNYQLPIGKARIARQGEGLTIITYGLAVRWAMEVAEQYDAEVIDLRSLVPWDREAVFASVKKTNKALVLYEATQTGGFGAEIAACIAEECFEMLDAPVRRLGSMDTPVPFHIELEKQFMAKSRLEEMLDDLSGY
ncbi:MAG: thiamine pyrophosphate-dependent enzyme [Bacteroidia bacterium]